MPGRQRVHRGVGPASPLPRQPVELDLGGLRQRDLPGRPPGDGEEPADDRLDSFALDLRRRLSDAEALEPAARSVVERMALVLQASLLVRHGAPAVADAFVSSRLGTEAGRAFGTLPAGADLRAIVDRATPRVA